MENRLNKRLKNFLCLILLSFGFAAVISCSKSTGPGNSPPVISSLTPKKTNNVQFGEQVAITANVQDIDGDTLRSVWNPERGSFAFVSIDSALWVAPDTSGRFEITLTVFDQNDAVANKSTFISVRNRIPVINSLTSSKTNVLVGSIITLRVNAIDPDGGPLDILWESAEGEFVSNVTLDSVRWKASTSVSNPVIKVTVTDNIGDFVQKEIAINVFQETGSVWVADTFNDRIVKLASNGTQLFELPGFDKPKGLAIDFSDRSLWVADEFRNRIVKFNANGTQVLELTGFKRPNSIVVKDNGNIWVTTSGDTAQVFELSQTGRILKSLKGFDNPRSIDVYESTQEIWIADTFNDRVVRLNPLVPNGYNLDSIAVAPLRFDIIFANYLKPEVLNINQANGNVWVSDTGNDRVVRIQNSAGFAQFVVAGFLRPRGIDINEKDGSAWIANSRDNEVIKILPGAFKLPIRLPFALNIDNDSGFHKVVSGFVQPTAISVDSDNGIIWFAEDFRIVKIIDSTTGEPTVDGEFSNFNAPKSLIINTGVGK